MSRRLLLGSPAALSAAALALVLVAPSAALADDHGKGSDKGKSGDKGRSQSSTQDKDDAKRSGKNDDPAGNNGTIKIDYAAPADSGHANRPHPGCAFQLRMFNFDDDQYGSITFEGQAPTKLGTLLSQPRVLLSDDAAGGGKDVDAVYSYTAQQLGLIGKPQAKQGWHVKVSVDAENAPGGAKHKVFWLKCPSTTTTSTTASGTTASGTTAQGGSTVTTKSVPSTVTTSGGTATAATAQTTATTASRGAAEGAAAEGAAEAAAAAQAPTSGAATASAPAAAESSEGSALPFTGFNLATVVVLALLTLGAGALAVVAGRRRAQDVTGS